VTAAELTAPEAEYQRPVPVTPALTTELARPVIEISADPFVRTRTSPLEALMAEMGVVTPDPALNWIVLVALTPVSCERSTSQQPAPFGNTMIEALVIAPVNMIVGSRY
jgi:hypothetical protein